MIIHQPVKNRTPAAMEAIVFRFSPQSMHSEHLKPSRNPDIFFFFQVSPAPPVQSVRNPVSPRAGLPHFPSSSQESKTATGRRIPGSNSTAPGAGMRMRLRGVGRGLGRKEDGLRKSQRATPTTPVSLRMLGTRQLEGLSAALCPQLDVGNGSCVQLSRSRPRPRGNFASIRGGSRKAGNAEFC